MGTSMFTTSLRTFEKFHCPEEPVAGSATWRSTNVRTSAPIISAIETIPIDQASLEAVLDFMSFRSLCAGS